MVCPPPTPALATNAASNPLPASLRRGSVTFNWLSTWVSPAGSDRSRSSSPETNTQAARAPAWGGTTSGCRCSTTSSAPSTPRSRPLTLGTLCRDTPPSSGRSVGAVPPGWALGVLPSESPPVPDPHHHPLAWPRASFSDAEGQGPRMDPHLSSLKELCRDLGAESGLAAVGSPTWGLCAQRPPPHTPKPLDLGDMLTFLAHG